MAAPTTVPDMTAAIAWLVDRAHIGDLLVEFARALDERDWAAYAATYTDDGVFEIQAPDGRTVARIEGRDTIAAVTESPAALGGYAGTWHGSSNHAITIRRGAGGDPSADTATTRSYLYGVHLLGGATTHHATGSGWYDCRLRRTGDPALAGGWRFAAVRVTEVWHAGEPLAHVAAPR